MKLNRRNILRAAGTMALASPFVHIKRSFKVQAQPGRAKYLLIYFTPGTNPGAWAPGSGSGNNSVNFSSYTSPLSAIKEDVVLVNNLRGLGQCINHGAPGALTGYGYNASGATSIEKYLGDRLASVGLGARRNYLRLGCRQNPNSGHTTFYDNGRAQPPTIAMSSAYTELFPQGTATTGGVTGGGGGGGNADPAAAAAAQKEYARRKAIFDLVDGDLEAFGSLVGREEAAKYALHKDSTAQARGLIAPAPANPGTPSAPVDTSATCSPPNQPNDQGPIPNAFQYCRLAIAAFACGTTRSAAIEIGHHHDIDVTIEDDNGNPQQTRNWHGHYMHSGGRLDLLERWLCRQFIANVINPLKQTDAPEGGKLYDHTLVLWARSLGDAVNHNANADQSMQYVFAGGAGGYLRRSAQGRYVNGNGGAHTQVLFNVFEAFGISDTAGFGNPQEITGNARQPLAGIKA